MAVQLLKASGSYGYIYIYEINVANCILQFFAIMQNHWMSTATVVG